MKIRTLEEAHVETLLAAAWYDDQQSGVGEKFLIELSRLRGEIVAEPRRFARDENYRGKREIRRALLQRFPYAITFEVSESEIIVVAVAHSSRQPNYWSGRKPG